MPCAAIAERENAIRGLWRGFNRCQALAIESMPKSVLRASVLLQNAFWQALAAQTPGWKWKRR